MLDDERNREALRSQRQIYLDAGLADEYYLQLGTRQVASRLAAAHIPFVHEEFDGGHMNTHFRYDRSFEVLSRALVSD
jgi:hypothetical protein